MDDLHALHRTLLDLLGQLDRLTHQEQPTCDRISAVRYRLSKASRARYLHLAQHVYPRAMEHASPAERLAIERLRNEGAALVAGSAGHIGAWTIDEIKARWGEYRAASAEIRALMRKRISAEQHLLYPLLRRTTLAAAA